MMYELINPSDCVTFDTEHRLPLAVAILLLTRGRCSLEDEKGEKALPLMLFGGVDEWVKENIPGGDIDAYIDAHALEMAEALESALYCDMGDRKAIIAAIATGSRGETREAFDRYNDAKRTSMNDINRACFAYAEKLRRLAEKKSAAAEGSETP